MKRGSILKNFAILAIFFSSFFGSTNADDNSTNIFDGYELFENSSTTTTTTTTTTIDEFDYFFDSIDATEPPTLEDKINNFASTIELAHDLATELKNELTENNSNDKEAEMLAVQLYDLTQTLSSMIESKQFPVLLKTALKLMESMRTCQDLANIGVTESGTYELDPDGPDSIAESIMVYCDFTTNVTEIIHDLESEIKIEKCPDGGNGCHITELNYEAPMDQIRALIAASETCEQSIRFDCYIAPLFSYGSDHMGFWRDWNGTQRTFFHGTLDANQTHMCQCGKQVFFFSFYYCFITFLQFFSGVNQTCIEPNLSCNCDAKLPDWQVDEGIITDKNLLPITEFAYGPLEYDLEEAKVSIGSLKCSGSTIGSTSHHFGPTQPVLPPPEILRNDCGLAELMTDNRLKINLRYSNNMNCFITLKLPETKTMKLTIDDFSSEGDYDYFYVYDGTYESRTRLKTYDGRKGDISYQWSGDAATFYWKTDGSSSGSSMTAYVDF